MSGSRRSTSPATSSPNRRSRPFDAGEVSPGPDVRSDDEILAWVARDAETALHPSCTCAMGTGEMSVVDPETMRVHGVEGLRVVDASVMPFVTNGNIYAPVMMIAEKAADLIAGNSPLPAEHIPYYRHAPYDGSTMRSRAGSWDSGRTGRPRGVVSDGPSDEIDLAVLADDDLVKQMHDDLYDGLADEIVEGTTILLDRGWSAERVLNDSLVEGMRIVGIDFRDGILFVPEVLLAANAMKAGMAILRPLLAETGAEPIGKVVIGTVKGDIHDIGKNLVAMMLEGAGFEVFDIGVNSDVDKYLAALEAHQPDILGLSALLTTTMPYMKVVVDTLESKGMRDDYIVLVGGAPLNEEFGKAVGADGYCRDASIAAEMATELVAARRNRLLAEPPGPSVR